MRVYDNGSRPELAVFDLDGTLYPRERYVDLVLDVIGRGLVELGGATSDATDSRVALLRAMMEENWDGTSTTAFVIAEGVDAAKWRDFRTQHLDIASGLTPDDRVVGHVAHLRRHVPVALLTNNTRARRPDPAEDRLSGRCVRRGGQRRGCRRASETVACGVPDSGRPPRRSSQE